MSRFALSPSLSMQAAALALRLERALQAEAYAVSQGQRVHKAFRTNYVGSTLERALIWELVSEISTEPRWAHRLDFIDLGSTGWTVILKDRRAGRRVALQGKVSEIDSRGRWVAQTNASSYLAQRLAEPRPPSLFDPFDMEEHEVLPVVRFDAEAWLLMMAIDSGTKTPSRMAVGRPVGLLGTSSPRRVVLDDIVEVDGGDFGPRAFPKTNDPLFPSEGRREEDGEDEADAG